jgi:replicative DNA helicase
VALSDLAETGERPLVWSLDERMRLVARPMLCVIPSGRQEASTLWLASGREVEATADSQFMTLGGWNRLSLGIGGFFRDSELTRPAAGERMGHSDYVQHFRGDEVDQFGYVFGAGVEAR